MTSTLRCALILLTVLVFSSAGARAGGGEVVQDEQGQLELEPAPKDQLPPGFVVPDAPYEERVLWMDAEKTRVMFVPQALFDRLLLEDLPLDERSREKLSYLIRNQRALRSAPYDPLGPRFQECASRTHNDPEEEPWPSAVPMPALISPRQASFVGTVVAVVVGWDAWYQDPAIAVYFAVEEVLHDRLGHLRVGEVVATHDLGGTIVVDGEEICTHRPRAFHQPAVGDQMLVAGEHFPSPPFFNAGLWLPIEDGKVLPQPIGTLRDRTPRDLEDLRAALAEVSDED